MIGKLPVGKVMDADDLEGYWKVKRSTLRNYDIQTKLTKEKRMIVLP